MFHSINYKIASSKQKIKTSKVIHTSQTNIWDTLRDLVLFVQLKNVKITHRGVLI